MLEKQNLTIAGAFASTDINLHMLRCQCKGVIAVLRVTSKQQRSSIVLNFLQQRSVSCTIQAQATCKKSQEVAGFHTQKEVLRINTWYACINDENENLVYHANNMILFRRKSSNAKYSFGTSSALTTNKACLVSIKTARFSQNQS